MQTKLIWITPDAEKLIASIARVSNPANQDNEEFEGLIKYMINHQHWSPFEMAAACFEINTTRDIGRQILRHRSFSFQEFSQRYADVSVLPLALPRKCRLQDKNNRQNSIECDDPEIAEWWDDHQNRVLTHCYSLYIKAINKGIAKEKARALLPEGLIPTRMYMQGSIRSWIHYVKLRTDVATQIEHREIAQSISDELKVHLPTLWGAL